jgi:tRNA A-37 threonylcarbamoyl transferase component Bud32
MDAQLEEAGEGLVYLHAQEIVHGDINDVRLSASAQATLSSIHR